MSNLMPWLSVVVVVLLFQSADALQARFCPAYRPAGTMLCPTDCPDRSEEDLAPTDYYYGPGASAGTCNFCYQCAERGKLCCPDACGTFCKDPVGEAQSDTTRSPVDILMGDFKIVEEATSSLANFTIRQDAINIATLATTYFVMADEVAKYIKLQFDKKYGKFWSVFVAASPNGAFYTYEAPGSIKLRWKNTVDIYIVLPYQW